MKNKIVQTVKDSRVYAVIATNIETGKTERYMSIRAASRALGISRSAIQKSAREHTANLKVGYSFEFCGEGKKLINCGHRPVIRTDPVTGERTRYESCRAAAKENYVSPSSITMCARGKSKTAVGYLWEYAK